MNDGKRNCPECGGSGWIVKEIKLKAMPWDNEKSTSTSGAAPCACRDQARAATREDRSNIPALYREASFDNFYLPVDNPDANAGLAKVMVGANQFVKEFPAGPCLGLLLIGDVGT